jgi:hypothetical protein
MFLLAQAHLLVEAARRDACLLLNQGRDLLNMRQAQARALKCFVVYCILLRPGSVPILAYLE